MIKLTEYFLNTEYQTKNIESDNIPENLIQNYYLNCNTSISLKYFILNFIFLLSRGKFKEFKTYQSTNSKHNFVLIF